MPRSSLYRWVAGVASVTFAALAVANGVSTVGGAIFATGAVGLMAVAVLGDRFKSWGPKGLEAFEMIREREVRRVMARVETVQAPQPSRDTAHVVAPDTIVGRGEVYSPSVRIEGEGSVRPTGELRVQKIPGHRLADAEQAMREASTPEELADRIVEYVQLSLFPEDPDADEET